MTLSDWHQRYLQQSQWTQEIRRHLFDKARLEPDDRVLEVGVGTGAIISQVAVDHDCGLIGIDIDYHSLRFAHAVLPTCSLTQADANLLPFPDDFFSFVYCHYLLMWVEDPTRVLAEMQRITRSGGYVVALAESDHSARIDFPPPLDVLGKLQTEALQIQGADIRMGRRLGGLFHERGFSDVKVGILGSQWQAGIAQDMDETEWMTLLSDLGERLSEEELAEYKQADQRARNAGSRVLFIPTFYAIGKA